MQKPLVSVICLCYNHQNFIREAVQSVMAQSYPAIQVIVADDASTDRSQSIILELKTEYPAITLLLLENNVGNCRAFNEAYALVKGDYVIDFSTDDVMMPDRIAKQVDFFLKQNFHVGVVFTDAIYVDESGAFLRNHFEHLLAHRMIDHVPEGNVYAAVLERYFIPGPTMMVRREVFDQLNGYDESLSFEDFDFWVRSSRYYEFAFLNEKLTSIRKLSKSMSTGWYVPGDKQLMSVYAVCCKAKDLNRTVDENNALIRRVRYEVRQSIITGNGSEAKLFFKLLGELGGVRMIDKVLMLGGRFQVLGIPLRRVYYKMRYGER